MCRKEIERAENTTRNDRKIIEEYKQICNNFESDKEQITVEMSRITEKVSSCDTCAEFIAGLQNKKNGSNTSSSDSMSDSNDTEADKFKNSLLKKISDLETELIRTKVALAEAEDRNGVCFDIFICIDFKL